MKLVQPNYYLLDTEEKELYEINNPERFLILKHNQLLCMIAKNFHTENQEAAALANMFYFVNNQLKHIHTSKRLEWQAKTSVTQSGYYRMILYLYGKEISLLRELDPNYFNEDVLFPARLRYYQNHVNMSVGLFEMFYCIE